MELDELNRKLSEKIKSRCLYCNSELDYRSGEWWNYECPECDAEFSIHETEYMGVVIIGRDYKVKMGGK